MSCPKIGLHKKIIQKAGKYFIEEEKHKIIQELISTQCTKVEIWEKYTGEEEEHSQLLRWMKQLGYNTEIKTRRPNIVSNLYPMAQKKLKHDKPVNNEDESFENLQLKKRIAALERNYKEKNVSKFYVD